MTKNYKWTELLQGISKKDSFRNAKSKSIPNIQDKHEKKKKLFHLEDFNLFCSESLKESFAS